MMDIYVELKSKLLLVVFAVMAITGCCQIKDINERYLSNIEVTDMSTKDKKIIKIKGAYGESAWGISSLFAKKERDNIVITGKLKLNSTEGIELILDIPEDVNNVFIYSRKIWTRGINKNIKGK